MPWKSLVTWSRFDVLEVAAEVIPAVALKAGMGGRKVRVSPQWRENFHQHFRFSVTASATCTFHHITIRS